MTRVSVDHIDAELGWLVASVNVGQSVGALLWATEVLQGSFLPNCAHR
jgi:hypothetical protein